MGSRIDLLLEDTRAMGLAVACRLAFLLAMMALWTPGSSWGQQPNDRATALALVSNAIATVKAFDECPDLPDFNGPSNVHEGLRFLPVSRGRFLIQVRCTVGAYNELSLVFAWDKRTASTLRLIVFPRPYEVAEATWSRKLGTVGMRDFDARRGLVFGLEKLVGDGSGGFYSEYRIDRTTFVPELVTAIYKPEADYKDGYNFRRAKRPSGKGWKRLDVGLHNRGCLVDVNAIDEGVSGCSTDQ